MFGNVRVATKTIFDAPLHLTKPKVPLQTISYCYIHSNKSIYLYSAQYDTCNTFMTFINDLYSKLLKHETKIMNAMIIN